MGCKYAPASRLIAVSLANGLVNAHRAGCTPTQTEADQTDLATLKQALQMVTELAHRRRGLPLLPVPDGNAPVPFPTEAQLIAQTTGAVQVLYDQLKRGQDSVAVVTNLLNSADPRCPNSPSHMDGQRRLLDVRDLARFF
ncbi:hypothetical protein FB451DRAFT_1516322 [Mycena latifolia]|nr:hypothetical protein FB451DRAFT_1516322 [Mycena latifolia]